MTGSLRIKIVDLGINVLGIFVSRKKDSWFFSLPSKISNHHLTGEIVKYPIFSFENKEKQFELITQVREKGRAFIEARLCDPTRPLVLPSKKEIKLAGSKTFKSSNDAPEAKESSLYCKV